MKKEMFTFGLIIFTTLLLFSSFAAAKITLSEPKDLYNIGDKLSITSKIISNTNTGNLNVDLICDNTSTNILKISARSFAINEEQTYPIPYKELSKNDLEIDNINDIIGECYVYASLGSDQASTKVFDITSSIALRAWTDKTKYNPGETITLNVEAVKANGDLLNGFLELSNATTVSKSIKDGKLAEKFAMSETSEAGIYSLNLYAYDTGLNNEILNNANNTLYIEINQVPSSIQNSLSTLEVTPGKDLTMGTDLFDQSGNKMNGIIDISIISPDNKEEYKSLNSDEFITIPFATNALAGKWKIISRYDTISSETEFQVLELQKVEFEFEDSILVVKNVGNTRYNKTINVNIGDSAQELNLDMNVGEEKRFNLKAPNGEYDVQVGDGETQTEKNLLLTGRAIDVTDLNNSSILKNYGWLWIFLLIIIAAIGTVLFMKFKRTGTISDRIKTFSSGIKESFKSNASESMELTNRSPESQSLDENTRIIDIAKPKIGKAESALVLGGEKSPSAIISIKILNNSELGQNAQIELSRIIEKCKENKGLVEKKESYIYIVFSPIITRTFKNELLASKTAFKLLGDLNAYNKKFKDKIRFNIGINSGDLVTSKEKDRLKYTSLGNTITLARKLSDTGEGKMLVTENFRSKIMRDLKVQKEGEINKMSFYSVLDITNREANREKLNDILKRMDNK